MVVTPKGYTKHYYDGSRHIAAQIGALENLPDDIIDTSAVAMERIANARAYMDAILNISEIQSIDTISVFADMEGDALDELQWQCNDEEWTLNATVYCDSNLLYPILTKDSTNLDRRVSDIYYYHSDHLGSATWITNSSRVPVEFIHYMPFGELWYDQQASAYNERFKFTGKERDTETGYDYFGARYYSSALPMWLSMDPLANKYPNISPYAYCNWNPLSYIDAHGDSTRLWVETQGVGHTWITTGEENNLQVYSYGRYDDLEKNKTFLRGLSMRGDGVLLKLVGDDAIQYQKDKISKNNPISISIPDISDLQMQTYFDKIFYESNELPSNEKGKYYQNTNAHVIDTYDLLYNNCTTKSIQAINSLGSNLFKSNVYIPSANGQGYMSNDIYRTFISPLTLSIFLRTR